jgi:NADH:ubiquinone oxidoreductase subunit C
MNEPNENALAVRLAEIPGAALLEAHGHGLWMTAPHIDVQHMARTMISLGCRLSTMSGTARENGETEVIYHYSLARTSLNIRTQTRGGTLPSISALERSASWIEREIHDLYAVTFVGHPNLERLLRPPQLEEGFCREPGGAAAKEAKA